MFRTSVRFRLMIRISIVIAVLSILLLSPPAQARPELSAASMMVPSGEPWLLYGNGLDAPRLIIQASPAVADESWDATASLARVLRRGVTLPDRPTTDAVRLAIYWRDANTAAIYPFARHREPQARLVWATDWEGSSQPLVLNRPEIWVVNPARLTPGGRARVFGPNLGSDIFLVGSDRKPYRCRWFTSYALERTTSMTFERTLQVPADLPTGKYQLYANNGGGDYGWSLPRDVDVVQPKPPSDVVFRAEATGDGQTPGGLPIQKAIDQAAQAGGGTVVLGAGIFRLEVGLQLKRGVTLRGAGAGATTLIAPRNGEIAPNGRNYRALVRMPSNSALEFLAIDASFGNDTTAVLMEEASDASIRDCRIINLNTVDRPEGKWLETARTLVAVGNFERLTLINNEFRGEKSFCHWGGAMHGAYVAYNRFEGTPLHSLNIYLRGLQNSVFEHNRVFNGGRGIVVAGQAVHNYFGHNIIQNIRGIPNGCEMFLYEMGQTKWHAAPGETGPDWFTTPDHLWDPKSLADSSSLSRYTLYALVTQGRGMGQCIPIASATNDRVVLARPWTSTPDQTSRIAVCFGCIENLHVENQFKEGVAYSGPYGSALRNAWVGEEFEAVSNGMTLWAIAGPRQVSLNLLRDIRCQDRAGIQLIADCMDEDHKPTSLTKVFGNEIRCCQIHQRRRSPDNSYGMGNKPWRYPFNSMPPGNAVMETFGDEAGVHLSQLNTGPGQVADNNPKFDTFPTVMRWNLIYDCLVARSPLAVRIGRGIERTIVIDLFSADNGKAVSDSGRESIILHTTTQPAPTPPDKK